DHDPARAEADAGGLETQALHIRAASSRDEEMAGGDRFLPPDAPGKHDLDLGLCLGNARDGHASAQRDALTRKLVEHDRRTFGVLARQRLSPPPPRDMRATFAAR